jgi:hypothetical protein
MRAENEGSPRCPGGCPKTQATTKRQESACIVTGGSDGREPGEPMWFGVLAARLMAQLHYRASQRGDQ